MLKGIVFTLLIAVAIISIVAGPNQTPAQFTKNAIGDLQGFGRCSNCGDSFWKKPYGMLMFSEISGVIICKECLSHPEKLNEDRIVKNLQAYFWPLEKTTLVHQAIKEFKIKRGIRYL